MDHSHMDHSHMDHSGMDHGDHGSMPGMDDMCNMNMLFTWDARNLCIIFKGWHVRGPGSLLFSLVAIVVICAGYEALREAIRRYEDFLSKQDDSPPNPPDEEADSGFHGGGYGSNNTGNQEGQQEGQEQQEQSTENTPFFARAGRNNQVAGQSTHRTRVIKSVLYGIQNFYAFMIMLLFMTYNGWVMIAVAVGAGVGYYLFGSHTKATKETACH